MKQDQTAASNILGIFFSVDGTQVAIIRIPKMTIAEAITEYYVILLKTQLPRYES